MIFVKPDVVMGSGGTLWKPVKAFSFNTLSMQGFVDPTNALYGFVQNEIGYFCQRVPSTVATPAILRNYQYLIADAAQGGTIGSPHTTAEGGLTFPAGPHSSPQPSGRGQLWCTEGATEYDGVNSSYALAHEFGHGVDFNYRTVNGTQRSQQADWQAIWSVAQTAKATYGPTYYLPGYIFPFYGWTNSDEFWAECFRCTWMGTGPHGNSDLASANGYPSFNGGAQVSNDHTLKVLLYGPPGLSVSNSDSNVVAVWNLMNSLTPPTV